MASSDSQIYKPQCGHPERADLPDVNINTGAQSINTERSALTIASYFQMHRLSLTVFHAILAYRVLTWQDYYNFNMLHVLIMITFNK